MNCRSRTSPAAEASDTTPTSSGGRKGARIRDSIGTIKAHARASRDPLRDKRFFILAAPEETLMREPGPRSTSREPYPEAVRFGTKHAPNFNFDKLGLNLIAIHDNGTATVHADARKIEQLEAWATGFETMGVRAKSRWASIAEFRVIPLSAKVDAGWLAAMESPGEACIELQPLLDRHDTNEVIRVIEGIVRQHRGESLERVSSDYSGRAWLAAILSSSTIKEIAESFASVDSIHAPLLTLPCAAPSKLFISQTQPKAASAWRATPPA